MKKPVAKLIGADGNVFNLIGIAGNSLLKAGLRDEKKEMVSRCFQASSYSEALVIIGEYVDIR